MQAMIPYVSGTIPELENFSEIDLVVNDEKNQDLTITKTVTGTDPEPPETGYQYSVLLTQGTSPYTTTDTFTAKLTKTDATTEDFTASVGDSGQLLVLGTGETSAHLPYLKNGEKLTVTEIIPSSQATAINITA